MSNRLRILIIEDNVDYADLVAMQLRDCGHDVYLAHDGATALMIARNRQLDAVLLDLRLPDLLGYEVARVMRDEGIVPNSSTIIVVTGDREADLDQADAVGIDVLLHKPISEAMLGRLIEFVHLRRKRKLATFIASK